MVTAKYRKSRQKKNKWGSFIFLHIFFDIFPFFPTESLEHLCWPVALKHSLIGTCEHNRGYSLSDKMAPKRYTNYDEKDLCLVSQDVQDWDAFSYRPTQ